MRARHRPLRFPRASWLRGYEWGILKSSPRSGPEREAKLVAAVSHPNIASIHSLDEADGVKFAVLELVEGQTLEERLQAGHLEAVASSHGAPRGHAMGGSSTSGPIARPGPRSWPSSSFPARRSTSAAPGSSLTSTTEPAGPGAGGAVGPLPHGVDYPDPRLSSCRAVSPRCSSATDLPSRFTCELVSV
jgi:hypothetical protein